MPYKSITVLIAGALLAGCSAEPSMVRVKDAPPVGELFPGVPVRVKTLQTVQLWRLDPEKDQYEKVSEGQMVLADQQRLYSIDVVSDLFASPGLRVSEYSDNTPKAVQVTSSENAAAQIDATNTVLSGLITTRNAAATAC